MTMSSMPQLVSGDHDDSASDEVILGVDTHSGVHVAAVITALGMLVGTANFPATAAGYQALVGWVGTLGMLRRAGVEGTGSYGAALARHLRAAGVDVIEVNQPDKAHRRRRARPTPSTPKPPPARYLAAGPAAAPRPVTDRWKCCGC
jgi:transposase